MRTQIVSASCLVVCLAAASAVQAQQVSAGDLVPLTLVVQEQPPQPAMAAPRAQTPQPTPPVAPQPGRMTNPPPPMRLQGQPINVRIELTITDQTGTAPAVKKTILMTVADEERGAIRSNVQIARGATMVGEARVGPPRIDNVPLSVDATPTVLTENRVRLRLNLEYDVVGGSSSSATGQVPAQGLLENSQVRQSLGVVLSSGVPLVVAQSADAHSDRRVSLEVKATILK